MLGLKNSSISNWEQGANTPDIETLFKLCKIFRIDVNEMYGCDTNSDYNLKLNDIEQEIIISYRQADDIDKAIVLRALKLDSKEKV